MIAPRTVFEDLLANVSRDNITVWATVVVVYWHVMLVLTQNIVGSYALVIRRERNLTRTQGIITLACTFHCIMAISVVVSWIVFSHRAVLGDVGLLIPVSTVAFILSCIYTTWRLGRWPGFSLRQYRRLSLPNFAIFNVRWWPFAYSRAHLERYERLRARRLGKPHAPRRRLPDDTEPPTLGGRVLLP